MKLQYKSVEKDAFSSIYVQRTDRPYQGGNWHFHKEYELIYFIEGGGMRIVGDHISHFQKGELVLVGESLPHLWKNDIDNADFIVVKFSKDFHGIDLFSLPELSEIKTLLHQSYRGILFSSGILSDVHPILIELSKSKGIEKVIHFLQLLKVLARAKNKQYLSSTTFSLPAQVSGENRLQRVIDFISNNYERPISLSEISEIAFMTPPAFCRFFKHRTNKTFSYFLNEFRIGRACQMLINGQKAIKQICFEAGFNSLTTFNRSFRELKGVSPSTYRANYQAIHQRNY